ncbi:MAG: mechanosensitive ion channel domain-containing protein [Tistlia sp.]|uniref:mechanosensitive ion channel family protein n=1 Tax=Tistlia sp. TaxID=3057121 RepID=UPI0034A1498E
MDSPFVETLDEQFGQLAEALPAIGIGLAVLAAFVLLGWLFGRGVRLALIRRGDRIHAGFLGQLPIWVMSLVGLAAAADIVGLEGLAAGLLAGGGATAIILGFAFRSIGENLLAGLFLVFSRPFRIGDLIQSGPLPEGTVRAVDLRNTHIRDANGRDIFIPNALVFNQPLINFTRDGLRRPVFTVGVDYHDPIEAVRGEILARIAKVDGVLETPAPKVVILEFPAAYVLLEVSIWINTFAGTDFPDTQSAAMEACRRAILDKGWTISADAQTAVALSGRLEAPGPATGSGRGEG